MALKFKIGDRVRLTRDIARCWQKGDSVMVLGPSHITIYPYGIKHGKHDGTMCVEEPEIVPEPKFKIGDRVRLCASIVPGWQRGDSVTISEMTDSTIYPYKVEHGKHGSTGWVEEPETELAPEPAAGPEPKFKIGDRVRFVRDIWMWPAGTVRTISEMTDSTIYPYKVGPDIHGGKIPVEESEIELALEPAAEPEPKFKIGDRVRLTRDIARCWQKGDSVTVLGPSHIKGFPYGIKHGKHDGTMCVEESEIEPVPEPAVEPEPKFKIGDQVRTLVNLGSWPVGTIGKIIRRGTAWGYDWRVKWDNVNKWWVNESEIELAPEPTTKPDMGDNIWSLGFPRDTRIPAGVSLRDYWEAPTWSDDLYRLLYDDLVGEIAHLRDELRRAKGE